MLFVREIIIRIHFYINIIFLESKMPKKEVHIQQKKIKKKESIFSLYIKYNVIYDNLLFFKRF